MPLESANNIFELNTLWPLGSDPGSITDDNLRMLKTILQTAYPIGSVVSNNTGTNPGTYIGGTWAALDDTYYDSGANFIHVGDQLIQWGERGGDSDGSVTFPIAYDSAVEVVECTAQGGGTSSTTTHPAALSTTGFTFRTRSVNASNFNPSTNTFYWTAIGTKAPPANAVTRYERTA